MTQHTPTPWHYDGEGDLRGPSDERIACWHYGRQDRGSRRVPVKPDRELIVHAVNLHAELVEALRAIMADCYPPDRWTTACSPSLTSADRARAVLAKAEREDV